MTMGEYLKKQRDDAGLTQMNAAVQAGVSIGTLLKLELDKPIGNMNVRTIQKVFRLYETDLVFGMSHAGNKRRVLFDAESKS